MSAETTSPGIDPTPPAAPSPATPRLGRRLVTALAGVAAVLLLVETWPVQKELAERHRQAWAEEMSRVPVAATYGQVRGFVTLDGEPLDSVEVAFLPDPTAGTNGATANSYTDDEGAYSLRTERSSHDGAVVGCHRVVVNDIAALPSPSGPPRGGDRPRRNRVPAAYSDPFRTPLRIEVRPGTQTIDLELVTPIAAPAPTATPTPTPESNP